MSEIPVHCVIETLGEGCCLKCTLQGEATRDKKRLLDSYAIVAGSTPLSKLNDVVLTAMGFPQYVSAQIHNEPPKSKGFILIDNWKPLTFDQITDDLEKPIEHLFKHIGGNRWTLNVVVSPSTAKIARAVDALMEDTPLIRRNEEALKAPDPEPTPRPSSDPINGVNWYHQLFPRYHPYLQNYNVFTPKLDGVSDSGLAALMANRFLLSNAEIRAAAALAGQSSPIQSSPRTPSWSDQEEKLSIDVQNRAESSQSRSPKYSSFPPQRGSVLVAPRGNAGSSTGTRQGTPATCRLMFDPLTELPMLNEWFEQNSHPTCHDIEKYTDLLNSKPYRRTYPPVSTHNVKIWFKNRRAKCKRV